MKKNQLMIILVALVMLSSCAAKKKLATLEEEHQQTEQELMQATNELSECLTKKSNMESKVKDLEEDVKYFKSVNAQLLDKAGNLATLSVKEAENMEKSLESIKEKDLQIRRMQDAINKKDSVTLALVTSLKGALGNLNDEDIEVNVEKGVVFISISDKLLFNSGSFVVSDRAKEVLGKVATVVNNKPDIEFMVEGHTDSKPVSRPNIEDNWDLSTKRATSVVRILQDDFGVAPERMTAAGRSYYVPVASNETEAGRAANRRTRIVVLPKIDQFYKMIEEGMESAK